MNKLNNGLISTRLAMGEACSYKHLAKCMPTPSCIISIGLIDKKNSQLSSGEIKHEIFNRFSGSQFTSDGSTAKQLSYT